jgi:hypothetical protein
MSEKGPESSGGKKKTEGFLKNARVEVGAVATGGVSAGLGYLLLKGMGAISGGLLLGTAIAAIAGYQFFKNVHG